jgi:hypothetical protein
VDINVSVFCEITQCILVKNINISEEPEASIPTDEKIQAPSFYETVVLFYQTIWLPIPKDNPQVHF